MQYSFKKITLRVLLCNCIVICTLTKAIVTMENSENIIQEKKDRKNSLILAIGLLIFIIILHSGTVNYMGTEMNKKFDNLKSADTIFLKTSHIAINDSTPSLKCLKNQFLASNEIKKYYFDIASTYYRNYYTFSICSIVFGTFLAISTFLLISKGWGNSTLLIKTFFVSSVLISSFYFLLPTVFKNEDNYKANLEKVKTFNEIQLNILSFSVSKKVNNKDSLSNFISMGYSDISSIFDLGTVEIDTEKLGDDPKKSLQTFNTNK